MHFLERIVFRRCERDIVFSQAADNMLAQTVFSLAADNMLAQTAFPIAADNMLAQTVFFH